MLYVICRMSMRRTKLEITKQIYNFPPLSQPSDSQTGIHTQFWRKLIGVDILNRVGKNPVFSRKVHRLLTCSILEKIFRKQYFYLKNIERFFFVLNSYVILCTGILRKNKKFLQKK